MSVAYRFGVTTDYEYSATHARQRLVVFSGAFFSTFEGEAFSLPRGDGFMVTTYNGDKIRVTCPGTRDERTYREVDSAISDALNQHYASNGVIAVGSAR